MATSSNGQFVTICASGCIHISNNFGATFLSSTFSTVMFAVCMSASGKYQIAVSTGVPTAVIYNSDNYGVNWSEHVNLLQEVLELPLRHISWSSWNKRGLLTRK
jgi:hypothetical protein